MKRINVIIIILLISVLNKLGVAGEFQIDGLYQIQLAERDDEHRFGFPNGILAISERKPRDIRDGDSTYVHVRKHSDHLMLSNSSWTISPTGTGTYLIKLMNSGYNNRFSGGLLTMDRSFDRDNRDRYSTYLHVKASNTPSYCPEWSISRNDDGTYKIMLCDFENMFPGYSDGLLTMHNSHGSDQRCQNSVYAHVRKNCEVAHLHNTNWNIVLLNHDAIIRDRNDTISRQNERIDDLEETIEFQNQTLRLREQTIWIREDSIRLQRLRILAHENTIVDLNKELTGKNSVLAIRGERLEAKKEEIRLKNIQIKRLIFATALSTSALIASNAAYMFKPTSDDLVKGGITIACMGLAYLLCNSSFNFNFTEGFRFVTVDVRMVGAEAGAVRVDAVGVENGGVNAVGAEAGAVNAVGAEAGAVRVDAVGVENGGVNAVGAEAGAVRVDAVGVENGGVNAVGAEAGAVRTNAGLMNF